MFNRRPRSVLPTFIIILLVLSFVYVLYINNSLQDKLKAMDAKTLRYQSQHQSLSSQLQVIYEDRSRMQNSLQKETAEHQNLKNKLQQQKESHGNTLQELTNSHKEKYESLLEEHAQAKDNLEKAKKRLSDISDEKKRLEMDKVNHNLAVEFHENEKKRMQAENQKLKDQYAELSETQQKNQVLHSNANLQLLKAEEQVRNYNELKNVLKQASADVLALDHAHFDEMNESDRLLLFSHFGGSQEHAQQLEDRRLQMRNEQFARNQALQRQQQDREERDKLLAQRPEVARHNPGIVNNVQGGLQNIPEPVKQAVENVPGASQSVQEGEQGLPNVIQNVNDGVHNGGGVVGNAPDSIQKGGNPVANQGGGIQDRGVAPQVQQTNICFLPPLRGQCQESHNLFFFDPRTSSCQMFMYSGCGGNENRFENIETCEQTCAGLGRNVPVQGAQIPQQMQVNPIQQQPQGVQPVNAVQEHREEVQPGNPKQEQSQEGQQHFVQHQNNVNQVEADGNGRGQPHQGGNQDQLNERSDEDHQKKLPEGLPRGDERYELVRQREVPLRPEQANVESEDGNKQNLNENRDVNIDEQHQQPKKEEENNALDIAEAKARDAEARAQEELNRLSDQAQEEKSEDGEKLVDKEKDPIQQFREMNEKQEKLAHAQAEDLARFAALTADEKRHQQMRGEITDEEGDENENTDKKEIKKEEEPDNQMLQPPAAKVAEEEQKPVIDVPGVKPKEMAANEKEYNGGGHLDGDKKKKSKESNQRYKEDQHERDPRLADGDEEYEEDEDPNDEEEEGLNEEDDGVRMADENKSRRNFH